MKTTKNELYNRMKKTIKPIWHEISGFGYGDARLELSSPLAKEIISFLDLTNKEHNRDFWNGYCIEINHSNELVISV